MDRAPWIKKKLGGAENTKGKRDFLLKQLLFLQFLSRLLSMSQTVKLTDAQGEFGRILINEIQSNQINKWRNKNKIETWFFSDKSKKKKKKKEKGKRKEEKTPKNRAKYKYVSNKYLQNKKKKNRNNKSENCSKRNVSNISTETATNTGTQ